EVVPEHDHRARLLAHLHDVALAQAVRRDGDALAVDIDVPVADELTSLVAAGREVGPEHDVVEGRLEHPQEVLARDALLTRRLRVQVVELLLEESVDTPGLLLLTQLEQVLALPD